MNFIVLWRSKENEVERSLFGWANNRKSLNRNPTICFPLLVYNRKIYKCINFQRTITSNDILNSTLCKIPWCKNFLGPNWLVSELKIRRSSRPSHCIWLCIHSSRSEFSFSLTPSLTWAHSCTHIYYSSRISKIIITFTYNSCIPLLLLLMLLPDFVCPDARRV